MPHRRVPPCKCGKGRLGHDGYDENAGCGLEGGTWPNFDQQSRIHPNRLDYYEEPLTDRGRSEWVSPDFFFGAPIPTPGNRSTSINNNTPSPATFGQSVDYSSTSEESSRPNYIIVSHLHRPESTTQTADVVTDTRGSSRLTSCVHTQNCTCRDARYYEWDSATYDMLAYFVLLFTSMVLLIDNASRGGVGAWVCVTPVILLLMIGGEFVARFWESRRG